MAAREAFGEPAIASLGEHLLSLAIGLGAGVVLSVLLSIAGPLLTVAALAGGALLVACFISLNFGLAALLILVALISRQDLFSASIPVMGGGLKVTDLILVAILLGWATREALDRRRRTLAFAPIILVLTFVLVALTSCAVAIGTGTFYKDSLLELRPLLQLLLVVPIVREAPELDLHRLVRIFLVVCVVSAIRALYLFSIGAGDPAPYTLGGTRVMAVGFAYPLIGVLIGSALAFRSARRRWVLALATLICFAGLLVTFYRSSYIGLAAAAIALWLIAGSDVRHRIVQVGVTAVVLLVLVGVFEAVRGQGGIISDTGRRFASLGSYSDDPSALHRLREWNTALDMIGNRPITGNGLGVRIGFESPMYSAELNRIGYWSHDIYMHNSYLWVATKLGIPGLLLFVGLLVGTLWKGLRPARESISEGDGEVAGLYLSLATVGILAVFGPMLTTDNMTPFFAFVVGVLWMTPSFDRAVA